MRRLFFFLSVLTSFMALGGTPEQNCNIPDSLNIPVYIIDGVECSFTDVDPTDILNIEIIKDPNLTRIFAPRRGGIVLVTTKSKTKLKQIVSEYYDDMEKAKAKRKPGELIIR
ncbi:MAG: hypothetical protein K2M07_07520 [Muribaculaceae bacterium]|nr:hypothetical protein [Muribaculaceae bacterium]